MATIDKMIVVGMADMNITRSPGILTTLGLGSCVGITLYDTTTKIAGMVHAMLPDSTQIRNNSNLAKFADSGTVKLCKDMVAMGAVKSTIQAKIAGGAQMFAFDATNAALRIGDRNVSAAIKILNLLRIPIVAQHTGENYGRTIELYSETGALVVKTIGHGTYTL